MIKLYRYKVVMFIFFARWMLDGMTLLLRYFMFIYKSLYFRHIEKYFGYISLKILYLIILYSNFNSHFYHDFALNSVKISSALSSR